MALRHLAVAALLAGTTTGTLHAQEREGRPFLLSVSRYAKWVFLGGAAGFTAAAALERSDADDVYNSLRRYCREDPALCAFATDGSYSNAEPEGFYQEVRRLDRRAQRFLVAGQLSLLGAGGLFLIDLLNGDDEPQNIPFTPLELQSSPGRLGVGLRF